MIKDYQDKHVLSEMKRMIFDAAKVSERDARISFVVAHIISEHHEFLESAGKRGVKDNLYKFISSCLCRFADELESPSEGKYLNPIELFKKEQNLPLLELVRFRTPAKNAVEKDLEETMEWPDNVPYEEWVEDMLQTAYASLFGLYFFNTPVKDMMRWLGKDEPKNRRFVNAMNRHETVLNCAEERARLHEADGPAPSVKKRKHFDLNTFEAKLGKAFMAASHDLFLQMIEREASGDVLRFSQEKEDAAFHIFMAGLIIMILPDKNEPREDILSSVDNSKLVYQVAKKKLMGDKLTKQIVTTADDKAAAMVFNWGLAYGELAIEKGVIRFKGDTDIRRETKPEILN